MPKLLRVGLAAALALVLVAVLAVVGLRWWRDAHRTELEEAVDRAPVGAQRLSWTDWSGVRRELGVSLDADSSADEVSDFLDQGYDADLTSTSALVESASTLQEKFGFSPASVDWELFTQTDEGAVVMMRLGSTEAVEAVGDRLESLGYTRPDDATGVWLGGGEVVARVGGLTPELQYIALDAADGLVLTSDTDGFLDTAMSAATGHGDSLGGGSGRAVEGLQDVVSASGSPLSAAIYAGDQACTALAMSQADESDQAQADELMDAAGKVSPLTGFAISAQPDRHVRVALGFETDDQARANADSRATLAAGPAPGQGGTFGDRFALGPVSADGRVVTLDLRPKQGTYVLSDLSSGPVLFATC